MSLPAASVSARHAGPYGCRGVRALASATLALLLSSFPVCVKAAISATGFQNRFYPVAGYIGSRVLEHNQTGRFSTYVEVTWSQSMMVDPSGRLWVADKTYHQVVLVRDGIYMEYAGKRGTPGFWDGTRRQALFNSPAGITLAQTAEGNLMIYVSDTNNHCIRLLDYRIGRTSTIVGVAGQQGLRDGPGSKARLRYPSSLGIDSAGLNLFVLDNYRRIRYIDLSQTIPTITTLVDGACRSVSKQMVATTVVLRTVGCHPDWRALDVGDTEVSMYTDDEMCVGHMATCGPRIFPALPDAHSSILELSPSQSA